MIDNRLNGKIALVTGASSGIGKASAEALAKCGVNLIIAARRIEILKEMKKNLEKNFKVSIHCLQMDVKDSNDVLEKISSLPKKWQEVDILINNAGLAIGTDNISDYEFKSIDTMIDTNVKGLMYVSRLIIPLMLKHKKISTIVNIGSVAGDFSYGGGSIYCASKAAVKAFSDAMRIDLMNTNIKVTNVKPGLVETEFSIIRFSGDKEKAKNVYKGIEPLVAEDIADAITYICNLPDNVQIPEITLTPLHQATVRDVYKNI